MNSVTLVVTVRNEQSSIDAFLASLRGQTRPPDEIVIVDGGSSDGTLKTLRQAAEANPRLVVQSAPGTTIARGRNIAIARSQGTIIAVTDAGTIAHPRWLERIVAPLETDPHLGVSSGFFVAGGSTWMERCIGSVITPQLEEIDPDRFLPSSRSVAFRKDWWERVGGYPEWLRHCEDLVFDLELRRAGARFTFRPDAVVTWRARPSLGRFFRQYFDYARGDGHAHLWLHRHAARYSSYACGLALLGRARQSNSARLALALGMTAHLGKYARRVHRRPPSTSVGGQLTGLAFSPVIVVTGDIAKMLGYPLGLYERAVGKYPGHPGHDSQHPPRLRRRRRRSSGT